MEEISPKETVRFTTNTGDTLVGTVLDQDEDGVLYVATILGRLWVDPDTWRELESSRHTTREGTA